MRFVVDTNILFSFFNEKSTARDLSTRFSLILYSPAFALKELNKYKHEIMKRFSLTELQFSFTIKLLQTVVNFIKKEEYLQFLPKSKEISPDPNDIDFFALSLKLNCEIWSNDADLKKQTSIKVLSTEDIVKKICL